MQLHIRQARATQRRARWPLASISLGDARNLDFEDKIADTVLMLGPVYHLVEKKGKTRGSVGSLPRLETGRSRVCSGHFQVHIGHRWFARDVHSGPCVHEDCETGSQEWSAPE